MELISVVVPVYNTKVYIALSIESILAQTYPHLELILIDDGSVDGSGHICDQYAAKDPRVKVIHQNNRGVSHARNVGLNEASGEYIAFVDADDSIAPVYLESLHRLLKDKDAEIAVCDVEYVFESKKDLDIRPYQTDEFEVVSGSEAAQRMLYQKVINSGPFAKLFRRELFKFIAFSEDIAIGEDLEVNYKLFLKSNKVAINLSKNYFYLQRAGSAMQSSFSIKRRDSIKVLKELLTNAKLKQPELISSIKNRLFIEAVILASEIPQGSHDFKTEYNECIQLIKSLRFNVFEDSESRFRFKVYASISLISPYALVCLFKIKKLPKKLHLGWSK